MPVSGPVNTAAARESLSLSGPNETDRPRPAGLSGALSHVVNTAANLFRRTLLPAGTAAAASPAASPAAHLSYHRLSTSDSICITVPDDRCEDAHDQPATAHPCAKISGTDKSSASSEAGRESGSAAEKEDESKQQLIMTNSSEHQRVDTERAEREKLTVENADNSLEEAYVVGRWLHSLCNPEEKLYGLWRGSIWTRLLVAAGLFTGGSAAGYWGYNYFRASKDDTNGMQHPPDIAPSPSPSNAHFTHSVSEHPYSKVEGQNRIALSARTEKNQDDNLTGSDDFATETTEDWEPEMSENEPDSGAVSDESAYFNTATEESFLPQDSTTSATRKLNKRDKSGSYNNKIKLAGEKIKKDIQLYFHNKKDRNKDRGIDADAYVDTIVERLINKKEINKISLKIALATVYKEIFFISENLLHGAGSLIIGGKETRILSRMRIASYSYLVKTSVKENSPYTSNPVSMEKVFCINFLLGKAKLFISGKKEAKNDMAVHFHFTRRYAKRFIADKNEREKLSTLSVPLTRIIKVFNHPDANKILENAEQRHPVLIEKLNNLIKMNENDTAYDVLSDELLKFAELLEETINHSDEPATTSGTVISSENLPEDELTALNSNDNLSPANMELMVSRLNSTYTAAYDPILDMKRYFDEQLRTGIREFKEKYPGHKKTITPTTSYSVTLQPVREASHFNPDKRTEFHEKVVYFTVADIVSGNYLLAISKMKDPLGRKYAIKSMTGKKLFEHLAQKNYQKDMEEKLQEYLNSGLKVNSLKDFMQNMIIYRCLKYLQHTRNHIIAKAVEKFLAGEAHAYTVYFNGTPVNGVFFIPAGKNTGVVLSVYDKTFYLVNEKSHEYTDSGRKKVIKYMHLPETTEFQQWILQKLPLYDAMKYAKDEKYFSLRTLNTQTLAMHGVVYKKPFSLKRSENIIELVDSLFKNEIAKLSHDSDTLIYTKNEQLKTNILEYLKKMSGYGSMLLSAAIPFVGGYLRMAFATGDALLIGTEIASPVVQAEMTTDPEISKLYYKEAMVSGIFGGFSFFGNGKIIVNSARKLIKISDPKKAIKQIGKIEEALSNNRIRTGAPRKDLPAEPPELWIRDDNGRFHKSPVASAVCQTGGRSLCAAAKNYQPTPGLSMASMARPDAKINNWYRDVPEFIRDLQDQNVKVLFSLDDKLSFNTLTSGEAAGTFIDRYLQRRLAEHGIEYVIKPENAIKDAFIFAANADITRPGPARNQVEQLASLVRQINTERAANPGKVVAVHCGAGDGRSGTVKSAVMMEKLLSENSGSYRDKVLADNREAKIFTALSDVFTPESHKTDGYRVVADAIHIVRETHKNAVERVSDVNLLNGYARYLATQR